MNYESEYKERKKYRKKEMQIQEIQLQSLDLCWSCFRTTIILPRDLVKLFFYFISRLQFSLILLYFSHSLFGVTTICSLSKRTFFPWRRILPQILSFLFSFVSSSCFFFFKSYFGSFAFLGHATQWIFISLIFLFSSQVIFCILFSLLVLWLFPYHHTVEIYFTMKLKPEALLR